MVSPIDGNVFAVGESEAHVVDFEKYRGLVPLHEYVGEFDKACRDGHLEESESRGRKRKWVLNICDLGLDKSRQTGRFVSISCLNTGNKTEVFN